MVNPVSRATSEMARATGWSPLVAGMTHIMDRPTRRADAGQRKLVLKLDNNWSDFSTLRDRSEVPDRGPAPEG